MKPKMYRKKKSTKGDDLYSWNPAGRNRNGGGNVAGTIVGPLSSVGDTPEHPSPHQGNTKDLEVPTGKTGTGRGYQWPQK